MLDPLRLDPDAYRLMKQGHYREALPFANRAVAGIRSCVPGHGMLAMILLQLGRSLEAQEVVDRAMALETGEAAAYDDLAYVASLLDGHDRANTLYRRATQLAPDVPRYWYNFACSERSFGRLSEAEEACNRCLALDAAQYSTYLMRAELRVQTPEQNHVDELRSRLAQDRADARARAYLGYALAKELDDLQRFDEAFDQFAAAAKARRSQLSYDVAGDERKLLRIAQVFGGMPAAPAPASPNAANGSGARCIFVVGLPRSGTTLVERILSGLAGVRSNGETENVASALNAGVRSTEAARIDGARGVRGAQRAGSVQGTGDLFERAAAADPVTMAATYARLARLGESGWVIEKQPTNYLYLGAIRRAMPNARIVWVSRCALDSCFAMYRTLFGEAYPFTYDFDELARYYAAYSALMTHWRGVLGDSLHEVCYEELVGEPSSIGERMAHHCGLSWDDRALDIANHRSVALTASAAQVRRPIYGSSSGRWRHYRAALQPLIAALRRYGVSVPQDA